MIIGFPHSSGHGGPGSFQFRFEQALLNKGHQVTYPNEQIRPDVVFVVGGTKRLGWLIKLKLKGIPIIHRLDGLAWLHRNQGIKALLYSEWGNFLFKFIHAFLATHVVYQSEFVKKWWDKSGWRKPKNYSIIYNGVDLEEFKPISSLGNPINILCVEGALDYSPYAIDLLNYLQSELIEKSDYCKLILYGAFLLPGSRERLHPSIEYRGEVSRSKISGVYKDAVYLSLDVNAACPNTVIEAMACGLPVVGYDTGALKELVGNGGIVVEYGGDPWGKVIPNFLTLSKALKNVISKYSKYSHEAKLRSAHQYSISDMVNRYMLIITKRIY